jgi:hypothetical protein
MAVEELDVVGTWPRFAGKTMNQMFAQESWFDGELDDEANVVWLQVDGAWNRLYFDSEIVYWKTESSGPPPMPSAPENAGGFALSDLGVKHGVAGQPIASVDGAWVENASEVSLRFDGGATLTFRNRFDTTRVRLTQGS